MVYDRHKTRIISASFATAMRSLHQIGYAYVGRYTEQELIDIAKQAYEAANDQYHKECEERENQQ